jgi:hypothetical protein
MNVTRKLVGWAAVLGTLPYLTLKALWLTGSTIGVRDTATFTQSSVLILNGVTAVMDAVAIVVALAFAYPWGQRIPALLVLIPIWVGTGFLIPIALLLPTMNLGGGQTLLDPWVQPMVYGGFGWQGLMLTIAFVLYARTRWPGIFHLNTAAAPAAGPARATTIHLGALLATASAIEQFIDGSPVLGALSLAAAMGAIVMIHRVPGPFWLPLTITWIGAGALFSWGSWGAVNGLAQTFLADGATPWSAITAGTAGLLIGLASLALLQRCPTTVYSSVRRPLA